MPTETIERTWKHDMCQTGEWLRLAFYADRSRKQAYEEHVKDCPACRAYFAEAAEKAEHPEVTDDEGK